MSSRLVRLTVAVVIGEVLGCGQPVQQPSYKSVPIARCGMKPFSLLDPATLGEVVSSVEVDTLNLQPSGVQSALAQTGYTAIPQIVYGSRVFQYRYTTQDRGQKIEATAVLGVPANTDLPKTPFPTAVFLHGTTGFSDACAPSRSVENDAAGALFAALGFVTILPDYIGMNGVGDASTAPHGYLVGEQVAIGSWDAVRAGLKLLASLRLGLTADNNVVIWGASQGGHAALFMEQWAPYYAPEFDVPGVVALVAPTALKPLANTAVSTWSPPTLAFASVMTTWQQWYGEPADLSTFATNTPPYNFATTLNSQIYVKTTCNTGDGYSAIKQDATQQKPETVYPQPFIDQVKRNDWSALPPYDCMMQENTLSTTSVAPRRHTPTFMAYSENDDLVVTAPMRDEFTHLCGLGYQLHFLECKGAGHVQGATWSLPEQIAWVHDRLDKKPLVDMCALHDPVCCLGSSKTTCTP